MADNSAWRWTDEVDDLPFDGSAAKLPQTKAVTGAAPKPQPFRSKEPERTVQPKPQKKNIQTTLTAKATAKATAFAETNPATKAEKMLRELTSVLVAATVGFIFVGMMLIIGSYANNYAKQRELKTLSAQLEKEKDVTTMMQKQVNQASASVDVYNRAIADLQMKKATGSDIIVLSITEGSETVSYLTEEEPERSITYQVIWK